MRTPDSGFEPLELRFERIQRFVPYLLLTFPLIPYVLSQSPAAGAVGRARPAAPPMTKAP